MDRKEAKHQAGEVVRETEPAAVIDAEAFERDQEDPQWREFIAASEEHLAALERDGRVR